MNFDNKILSKIRGNIKAYSKKTYKIIHAKAHYNHRIFHLKYVSKNRLTIWQK